MVDDEWPVKNAKTSSLKTITRRVWEFVIQICICKNARITSGHLWSN